MKTLAMTELSTCHKCSAALRPHPLYEESVAMTCMDHGDFFVHQERDKEPVVVFRAFDGEDDEELEEESVNHDSKPKPTTTRKMKIWERYRSSVTVRCDQTGVIYKSQTDAAKAHGVGQSEISKHLKGYDLTVGGFTFSKIVDDGKGEVVAVPRPQIPRNESRFPIAIKCDQTGEVFASIRQAAEVLGIPKTTIRYRLHRPLKYNKDMEYTFSLVASQKKHGLI